MENSGLLAAIPEVRIESETAAERLMRELAESEGHQPVGRKLVSAFSVKKNANDAGCSDAFWTEHVKHQGETARRRSFLASYWILSRNGAIFYGRGIRIGNLMLWPDKGAIRELLNLGHIRMEKCKFVLTETGTEIVESVIRKAPWSRISQSVPQAAAIADFLAKYE